MSMMFRMNLKDQVTALPDTNLSQIHDYAKHGLAMGPQRIVIYGAALLLQAAYLSIVSAAISAILILVAEIFDGRTFSQAAKVGPDDLDGIRILQRRIHIGAFFSSGVISFFALSIAFLRDDSSLFLPMLFLFAAAVFGAAHNHQIISVLATRLAVYSATFVAIPLVELLGAGGASGKETWLNFLTSLFVLFFVLDCSAIGLRSYRTNRQQLEQLRVENKRASHALVSKTEFLSTVSHELRTPLTSIRASLDMALAGAFGPLPDKSVQVLSIAQRNACRLSRLIDELLDLQKIEVGMMKFDFCDVQLSSLLQDTVLDNRAYAAELGVTINMKPIDPELFVRADPMRLEQVITNLLSNASKFSEPGSDININAVKDGSTIRINVIDQGIGIDPADRSQIFDSFTQLDNEDIRKVNGTGLGLNISKRIVEAHNGIIDFEPNTPQGTNFFIELEGIPAQEADGSPATSD
ncbi:MAG: HAMP domain-containing sensor histidine kinase [Sulfitobacter sp.]